MSVREKLPFFFLALGFALSACSSGPEIKQQQYARLSNTKEFEAEYEVVWKAIAGATEEYKIEKKDSEKGELLTDWVYTTSNEKYFEYQVNGFPRKHYLQTRYRVSIKATKQLGSVKVTVEPIEEVEQLKSDGSFDKWKTSDEPDSSRAADMIQKIELKILARPT